MYQNMPFDLISLFVGQIKFSCINMHKKYVSQNQLYTLDSRRIRPHHKKSSGARMESQWSHTFGQSIIATLYRAQIGSPRHWHAPSISCHVIEDLTHLPQWALTLGEEEKKIILSTDRTEELSISILSFSKQNDSSFLTRVFNIIVRSLGNSKTALTPDTWPRGLWIWPWPL